MNVTRRSFFSTLICAIPVPFIFGRIRKANVLEATDYPELRKQLQEQHCYPDLTYYEHYVETKTGKIIPGSEIRYFLDWTPQHPEQPRYARFITATILSGYRRIERAVTWDLITYLDSELVPYPFNTERGMLDGIQPRMVGESFKYTFPHPGIYKL
jgi:hypothetical protein